MAFTKGPVFGHGNVNTAFASGTGEVDEIFTVDHKFNILNICIHLSAAGGASENLVIQVDHGVSTSFDFTLMKQDMATITDLIYQPSSIDSALVFTGSDKINFTYNNQNNRSWGIMVTYGYMGFEE